jgi:hypothetical protein
VVAIGMYMIPSNLDLYIGKINGYNNLIVIASDDLQLGHNDEVNDEPPIINDEFDSPQDDFADDSVESTSVEPTQPTDEFDTPQKQSKLNEQFDTPQEHDEQKQFDTSQEQQPTNELTHDDKKLMIILGSTILGSAAIWTLK